MSTQKPPLRVTFDTSALRGAGGPSRGNSALDALEQPCLSGELDVLLHRLVVDELISGLVEQAIANIEPVRSLSGPLVWANGDSSLQSISRELEALRSMGGGIESSLRAGVMDWIVRIDAVVEPIGAEHARRVFNHYFAGSGAFAAPKSRPDLPDAFILEWVRDLANNGPVLFVVGDKQLRKAVRDVPDVSTVVSVAKLLGTREFVAILDKLYGGEEGRLWRQEACVVTSRQMEAVERSVCEFVERDIEAASLPMVDGMIVVSTQELRGSCRLALSLGRRTGVDEMTVPADIRVQAVLVVRDDVLKATVSDGGADEITSTQREVERSAEITFRAKVQLSFRSKFGIIEIATVDSVFEKSDISVEMMSG